MAYRPTKPVFLRCPPDLLSHVAVCRYVIAGSKQVRIPDSIDSVPLASGTTGLAPCLIDFSGGAATKTGLVGRLDPPSTRDGVLTDLRSRGGRHVFDDACRLPTQGASGGKGRRMTRH